MAMDLVEFNMALVSLENSFQIFNVEYNFLSKIAVQVIMDSQ